MPDEQSAELDTSIAPKDLLWLSGSVQVSFPLCGSLEHMIATKRILTYLAVIPFSFLLFALGWLLIGPSCLYHCWDEIGRAHV